MQPNNSLNTDVQFTIGQYVRPSLEHHPVERYWTPEEFAQLGAIASSLGFSQVLSAPLARSSYHAGENGVTIVSSYIVSAR